MHLSLHVPSLEELQMDIFQYSFVTDILEDYFQKCRVFNHRLSLRYFSRVIFEKNTAGYIQSILNKKYRFSDTMLNRLSELMQLSGDELEYLMVLVRLWELEESYQLSEQSLLELSDKLSPSVMRRLEPMVGSDFPLRQLFLDTVKEALSGEWSEEVQRYVLQYTQVSGRETPLHRLYSRLKDELNHKNRRTLFMAQDKCLSSWSHWLVLELAKYNPNPVDISWYSKVLHPLVALTGVEVEQCLADLQEAQLMIQQGGIWHVTMDYLEVDPKSLKLKEYHSQLLDQAKLSLQTPPQTREYNNCLIPTSYQKFMSAKRQLRQFREQLIRELEESEAPELLASLSWQLFYTAEFSNKETP